MSEMVAMCWSLPSLSTTAQRLRDLPYSSRGAPPRPLAAHRSALLRLRPRDPLLHFVAFACLFVHWAIYVKLRNRFPSTCPK